MKTILNLSFWLVKCEAVFPLRKVTEESRSLEELKMSVLSLQSRICYHLVMLPSSHIILGKLLTISELVPTTIKKRFIIISTPWE